MTPELNKSQAALEQLADLNETLKKEKIELTPEVEKYVREHIRAVQDKLQAGQDVYESDLDFIKKVKMWVLAPKNVREILPSIEKMYAEQPEADKRHISLKQWLDLLHIMKAKDEKREWVDDIFKFPGLGKIEAEYLNLKGCTSLTALPEGLYVDFSLNLDGCTALTALTEGLSVGFNLDLKGCTSLTALPEGLYVGLNLNLAGCTGLTSLPEGLKVRGYLSLFYCAQLTSLPENLSVGGDLDLSGCTSLKTLPESLLVKGKLLLNDPNEQVLDDARRLTREGKIKNKGIRRIVKIKEKN